MAPRDPKGTLKFLATVLHMDVVGLLQSSLVRINADAFFHYNRDAFFTNPANTILYRALRALEERVVVHVAEVLKDENGAFGVPQGLRGVMDLRFHPSLLCDLRRSGTDPIRGTASGEASGDPRRVGRDP